MAAHTLQAWSLSGKWRLVPYAVHEAGIAESTTLACAGTKRWTRGQLTTDEPETVENTGEHSAVFRVSDLSDITGSCGRGQGYSDTENETPALELCHGVGWRLDAGADDDERGWKITRSQIGFIYGISLRGSDQPPANIPHRRPQVSVSGPANNEPVIFPIANGARMRQRRVWLISPS